MLLVSAQVQVAQFRARELCRLPVALDDRALRRVLRLS